MSNKGKRMDLLCDMAGMTVPVMDGFDDAIIGLGYQAGKGPFAVYDRPRCIGILVGHGMSLDEAEEHFQYNVESAWIGDNTPVIVVTLDEMQTEADNERRGRKARGRNRHRRSPPSARRGG